MKYDIGDFQQQTDEICTFTLAYNVKKRDYKGTDTVPEVPFPENIGFAIWRSRYTSAIVSVAHMSSNEPFALRLSFFISKVAMKSVVYT